MVLTAALVYQWWFNPNTGWWRLVARQRTLTEMIRKNQNRQAVISAMGAGGYERLLSLFPNHPEAAKVKAIQAQVRTTLAAYQEFVRRYPDHPKTAAARVIMTWLEEQLDCGNPRILEVRSEFMESYGNTQAAVEVENVLRESFFNGISAEALACIAPREFARSRAADTIVQKGWIFAENSKSKMGFGLPFPGDYTPNLIVDTQTWRHDLGRVAFATCPRIVAPRTSAVRWTVWIADLKAGRLRAFLPSKPMPDPKKTKKPLLIWSPDGKRLTCGGETFVVTNGASSNGSKPRQNR
jgi:hypothetical protein